MPYNIDDMIISDTFVHCGTPVIEFVTSNDLTLPAIFSEEKITVPNYKLILAQNSSPGIAQDYYLKWRFWYSDQPSNVVLAPVFLVQVIDRCDPHPIDYTPMPVINVPSFTDQTLYITYPVQYTTPSFTVTPVECLSRLSVTYTGAVPTTVGNDGDAVTSYASGVFDFAYNGFDLVGLVSQLTLTASIDGKYTQTGSFQLEIKNPCNDPNLAKLSTVTISGTSYQTFATDIGLPHRVYTHTEATLVQTGNGICGPIAYESSFDGVSLTTSTSPLTYDSTT